MSPQTRGQHWILAHLPGTHGPTGVNLAGWQLDAITGKHLKRAQASTELFVMRRNHANWCPCNGPRMWEWDTEKRTYILLPK